MTEINRLAELVREPLWDPSGNAVMIPRNGQSRGKARYEGYRLLDQDGFGVGIGHFYPDDFRVSVAWLRPADNPNEDFTHDLCDKGDPGAEEYWFVDYRPRKREWRDGAWRTKRD